MKFVNIRTEAPRQKLLEMLADNDRTNRNVSFDDKCGTPRFHLKEKGDRISIKCEYVGGATKDNAFLDGTVYKGKIKESGGQTVISGIITTAPIFHLIMIILLGVFIYQCIALKGFNIVPVCLVVFDIFMFYKEFGKQGMIKRYIQRAVRRCEAEMS